MPSKKSRPFYNSVPIIGNIAESAGCHLPEKSVDKGVHKIYTSLLPSQQLYYKLETLQLNSNTILWRIIQFKDEALVKYATEKNGVPENFSSMCYTLVSKQHGLEAIKSIINIADNPRLYTYGLNTGAYIFFHFDIFWRVKQVDDIAAIKKTFR